MLISYMGIPGLKYRVDKFMPDGKKVEEIIKIISEDQSLTKSQIVSTKSDRNFTYARQLCVFFIKKHTDFSLPFIASIFGYKSHRSVIDCIRTVNDLVLEKPKTKNDVDRISDSINFYN